MKVLKILSHRVQLSLIPRPSSEGALGMRLSWTSSICLTWGGIIRSYNIVTLVRIKRLYWLNVVCLLISSCAVYVNKLSSSLLIYRAHNPIYSLTNGGLQKQKQAVSGDHTYECIAIRPRNPEDPEDRCNPEGHSHPCSLESHDRSGFQWTQATVQWHKTIIIHNA